MQSSKSVQTRSPFFAVGRSTTLQPGRLNFLATYPEVLSSRHTDSLNIRARAERSDAAIFAFSAFRTNADIVVPELIYLMKDHPIAIEALARLGAQGLPPLLTAWSNSTNKNERWEIQYAIVDNLAPRVGNTNLVPLLLTTMQQSAQSLRVAASNALFQIAPEVLTNTTTHP